MKKYSSIDLIEKLYLKLYATDIICDNVNTVEFKVSIDLMQHVNVTYDNHFIVISPIEYDGSTDYIIDDLSNDEHDNQCVKFNVRECRFFNFSCVFDNCDFFGFFNFCDCGSVQSVKKFVIGICK